MAQTPSWHKPMMLWGSEWCELDLSSLSLLLALPFCLFFIQFTSTVLQALEKGILGTVRLMWEALWEEDISRCVQDKVVLDATVQCFQ